MICSNLISVHMGKYVLGRVLKIVYGKRNYASQTFQGSFRKLPSLWQLMQSAWVTWKHLDKNPCQNAIKNLVSQGIRALCVEENLLCLVRVPAALTCHYQPKKPHWGPPSTYPLPMGWELLEGSGLGTKSCTPVLWGFLFSGNSKFLRASKIRAYWKELQNDLMTLSNWERTWLVKFSIGVCSGSHRMGKNSHCKIIDSEWTITIRSETLP